MCCITIDLVLFENEDYMYQSKYIASPPAMINREPTYPLTYSLDGTDWFGHRFGLVLKRETIDPIHPKTTGVTCLQSNLNSPNKTQNEKPDMPVLLVTFGLSCDAFVSRAFSRSYIFLIGQELPMPNCFRG